jgi:uncharacterized protein involved in exopolysaccharide biosynthesis
MPANSTGEMDAAARSGFVSYATAVLREWRLVLAVMAATVVAALILSLFRTSAYEARTTLFENTAEPAVSGMMSQLPAGRAMGLGTSQPNRLVRLVVRSQSLRDSVLVRAGASASINAQANQDGSIVVDVRASDPQVAVRVANLYPEVINDFLARIGAETAARRQDYLEGQLQGARDRLEQVETRVVAFQTERGAPEIREQLTATIERAMMLEQQIAEQEIQVNLLRRTSAPGNPALRAAEAALDARRELRRGLQAERAGSLLPSLGETPELQVAATRFLRELTEAEQFYFTISVALASSQVSAGENLPAVAVLDPAMPPNAPAGAGLLVITAVAIVLGLLLALVAVFIRELVERGRRSESFVPFFEEWDGFKAAISRKIRRRSGGEARPVVGEAAPRGGARVS